MYYTPKQITDWIASLEGLPPLPITVTLAMLARSAQDADTPDVDAVIANPPYGAWDSAGQAA